LPTGEDQRQHDLEHTAHANLQRASEPTFNSVGVDPSQFDLTDQWESLQAFDPNLQLADLYHRFQALVPQLRARPGADQADLA
jgi:hypothetical protein